MIDNMNSFESMQNSILQISPDHKTRNRVTTSFKNFNEIRQDQEHVSKSMSRSENKSSNLYKYGQKSLKDRIYGDNYLDTRPSRNNFGGISKTRQSLQRVGFINTNDQSLSYIKESSLV